MAPLLAALAGLGLYLSFPPAALWPLAFGALVPLLVALDPAGPRSAFWLGTLAGMVFYPLNLSWATHALAVYGGLSWGVSVLVLGLLSFYLALYLGVFAAGWVRFRPASAVGQALFAASLWVTLEFARTYLLTGFPWAFLAYTQSRTLPLIQIASVTGMYGVSFLIALVNAALALALRQDRGRAALAPAVAAVVEEQDGGRDAQTPAQELHPFQPVGHGVERLPQASDLLRLVDRRAPGEIS